MKIMIVLAYLHGGGAERVATILANNFVQLGHKVIFATNKKRSDEPFVYSIDERVTLSKCYERFLEPRKNKVLQNLIDKSGLARHAYHFVFSRFEPYVTLRRIMVREKPDVVLGFMHTASFQALIASLGTDAIVISTEHNAFERPAGVPFPFKSRFFKFVVNKYFKAVTVLTSTDGRIARKTLKNVRVIPNPLSFKVHDTTGTEKRQKRIVAAGRLDAWHYKGFDLLIEAWGKIARKCEGWSLEIAGCGSEDSVSLLKTLIRQNDVEDSVTLSGFQNDISAVFRKAEIFVLSSRCEAFGMVLIEAMSQGCACIACDYNGRQREIIKNDSEGIIVEPGNAEALSEAMMRLVRNDYDRMAIRECGLLRSCEYEASKITQYWLKLFNELSVLK